MLILICTGHSRPLHIHIVSLSIDIRLCWSIISPFFDSIPSNVNWKWMNVESPKNSGDLQYKRRTLVYVSVDCISMMINCNHMHQSKKLILILAPIILYCVSNRSTTARLRKPFWERWHDKRSQKQGTIIPYIRQ